MYLTALCWIILILFMYFFCQGSHTEAAYSTKGQTYVLYADSFSLGLLVWMLRLTNLVSYCGRPWPAAYINFNQNTHQIQVFTKHLCRAQALLYSLPNNEWGTKYRWLTYSAK